VQRPVGRADVLPELPAHGGAANHRGGQGQKPQAGWGSTSARVHGNGAQRLCQGGFEMFTPTIYIHREEKASFGVTNYKLQVINDKTQC